MKKTEPAIFLRLHIDRDGEHSRLEFYPCDETGRSFGDSMNCHPDFWLKDFMIGNLMSHHFNHSYAEEICYKPYKVGLDELRKMTATLGKIHKGLDAITKKYGLPQSYGQFVSRVAIVLGAKVRIHNEDDRLLYNDWTTAECVAAIDHRVKMELDRLHERKAA